MSNIVRSSYNMISVIDYKKLIELQSNQPVINNGILNKSKITGNSNLTIVKSTNVSKQKVLKK